MEVSAAARGVSESRCWRAQCTPHFFHFSGEQQLAIDPFFTTFGQDDRPGKIHREWRIVPRQWPIVRIQEGHRHPAHEVVIVRLHRLDRTGPMSRLEQARVAEYPRRAPGLRDPQPSAAAQWTGAVMGPGILSGKSSFVHPRTEPHDQFANFILWFLFFQIPELFRGPIATRGRILLGILALGGRSRGLRITPATTASADQARPDHPQAGQQAEPCPDTANRPWKHSTW